MRHNVYQRLILPQTGIETSKTDEVVVLPQCELSGGYSRGD